MPKGAIGEKRPGDVIGAATVAKIATGTHPPRSAPPPRDTALHGSGELVEDGDLSERAEISQKRHYLGGNPL